MRSGSTSSCVRTSSPVSTMSYGSSMRNGRPVLPKKMGTGAYKSLYLTRAQIYPDCMNNIYVQIH